MEEEIKFLTPNRENKIRNIFKYLKEKHNIEIVPTSKIAGLSGMNSEICKEVLEEMEALGKSKLVKENGQKKYWQLINPEAIA